MLGMISWLCAGWALTATTYGGLYAWAKRRCDRRHPAAVRTVFHFGGLPHGAAHPANQNAKHPLHWGNEA